MKPLHWACLPLILATTVPAAARADGRPNVLLVIGDDHAGGTLGVDGDPRGATPRLTWR